VRAEEGQQSRCHEWSLFDLGELVEEPFHLSVVTTDQLGHWETRLHGDSSHIGQRSGQPVYRVRYPPPLRAKPSLGGGLMRFQSFMCG